MAKEAQCSGSSSAEMHANNYKGKLFGYAHAHRFDEPNYIFKNEGLPHAPHFRATVHVAGHTFTAPETFTRRKDAEQFISKLAFESLSHQASANVVSPSFLEGSKLCKSILYEYCVKKGNMVLPLYDTTVSDHGSCTVFRSEVVYGNNTFVGPLSKSKKEAEQNAALVVITSLFENSETRFLMSEVIEKVVSAIAGSAAFTSNQNPNPNDNAASHVGSVKEHEEVIEINAPVSPGWIVSNKAYKSILKEYSDKKGCKVPPLYNTHTHALQAHVSAVSFEGQMYHGPLAKSKKEAEHAAARVAIDCILGKPESKIVMLQIMHSKIKLKPSWNVSLISNPSTDQVNATLDQVNTESKYQEVGDSGATLAGSLPLVMSSAGAGSSVLGQSEETKVEDLPAVGLSRNARKRARRKERYLEAKKVKLQ